MNQHSPMHQLAVLSMGWAAFSHPASIIQLSLVSPMHQLAVLSMGWAAFSHPASIIQLSLVLDR
jgi:hypothetical protein